MCFSAAASFTAAGFLMMLGVANWCLVFLAHHGRCSCCRHQQQDDDDDDDRPQSNSSNQKKKMSFSQRASLGLVASIPFLFGAHQLSEGYVWQDPNNENAVRCFTYTAYVFWPVYIAISFALVEWTRRPSSSSSRGQSQPLLLPTSNGGWSYWPGAYWPVRRRQSVLAVHVILAVAMMGYVLRDKVANDPNTVLVNDGRLHYEGWGLGNRAHTLVHRLGYVYIVVGTLVASSLRYSTIFGALVLVSLVLAMVLYENQYPSTWCFFSAILSCLITLIVWYELDRYDHYDEGGNNNNDENGGHGDEEEDVPGSTEPNHDNKPSSAKQMEVAVQHGCD
jgi:hypothetical protein